VKGHSSIDRRLKSGAKAEKKLASDPQNNGKKTESLARLWRGAGETPAIPVI
jgi:hypothetical protein